MTEAHFAEIENVIEFYNAHEVDVQKLISLTADKFGADDHLLSLGILASLNRHPGVVADFKLVEMLNTARLDKMIELMKDVLELEKRMVKYEKQLKVKIRVYEESL